MRAAYEVDSKAPSDAAILEAAGIACDWRNDGLPSWIGSASVHRAHGWFAGDRSHTMPEWHWRRNDDDAPVLQAASARDDARKSRARPPVASADTVCCLTLLRSRPDRLLVL